MAMIPNFPVEQICDAILDGFSPTEFRQLLHTRLDISQDKLVPPGPFSQTVFKVVEHAERAGWLRELVEATYRENPRNRTLSDLYKRLGLAPNAAVQRGGSSVFEGGLESVGMQERGGFESIVGRQNPAIDQETWTRTLAQVADRVCRIEDEGRPLATGFLVGPDAVLTCDFVLDDLISGRAEPSRYSFRFEYKVLADGSRSDGVAVGLHTTDWLIDHSPRAPGDCNEAGTDGPLPNPDQLGYALVRLARPLGTEPPAWAAGGPMRGWISVPFTPSPPIPGSGIVIAHYPLGEPLKIALDFEGLIGPNANNTRLWYSVTTEPGSSGAPCFDHNWTLLALHQGRVGESSRRQGVTIAAIRDLLAARNKLAALGSAGSSSLSPQG